MQSSSYDIGERRPLFTVFLVLTQFALLNVFCMDSVVVFFGLISFVVRVSSYSLQEHYPEVHMMHRLSLECTVCCTKHGLFCNGIVGAK